MQPAATRIRSVFAPVTALAFKATQWEDLKAFLERQAEHTELIPISDASQLLMTADGRLAESGYRFNYLGFQSLSNGIASGLCSVFCELSRENYQRANTDIEPDLTAAITVYNTAVRSRIDALRERTLLVDHRERVVEGFMGLNHRMLDNSTFLELVQTEVASCQPRAQFHRAELVGRDLTLYYVDPQTMRKDIYAQDGHSIVGGWLFNNREDRGKAIQAVLCLLTRFGAAREKARANSRLMHTGSDLAGRAAIMVGKALGRELDMTTVLTQLANMQSKLMGFTDDNKKLEQAYQPWIESLCRSGVLQVDAKAILRNTALVGADLTPRDAVDAFTNSVLTSRTAYDLLCAILRFARSEPSGNRERLQALAMEMLYPQKRKRRTKQ
jgi:hypothetical protein